MNQTKYFNLKKMKKKVIKKCKMEIINNKRALTKGYPGRLMGNFSEFAQNSMKLINHFYSINKLTNLV